jgi:hypothetical protein
LVSCGNKLSLQSRSSLVTAPCFSSAASNRNLQLAPDMRQVNIATIVFTAQTTKFLTSLGQLPLHKNQLCFTLGDLLLDTL